MLTQSLQSCVVANGEAVDRDAVPRVPVAEFRQAVVRAVKRGARLAAMFGVPDGESLVLYAVLADALAGRLALASTDVTGTYPGLTPDCPQAQGFEREIAEESGVVPQGHPWLKPLRSHAQYAPAVRSDGLRRVAPRDRVVPRLGGPGPSKPAAPGPPRRDVACGVSGFFQVEGDEVHEVAVGPVHAGIIEPGHFRFQCHGEQVLHLEIALGYQHRGIERALIGGPTKRTLHYMETLAGDTSVGHATAYCEVLEALSAATVPPRAEVLRGIALELERLANHVGDLGALAADVGYLPTASFCGRIRGDFLNITALVCGNRFGRGMVRPGGVGFDVTAQNVGELLERLDRALRDAAGAVKLLWDTPSVRARLDETGILPRGVCEELGIVGVAARASGLERDARRDFPSGIYRFAQVPVSTAPSGDVFARAYVRWLEVERSAAFVREQLRALPGGPVQSAPTRQPTNGRSKQVTRIATKGGGIDSACLKPSAVAVAMVEGWRGEICHVALTDEAGRFAAYKVVDPSFHNWMGLALALRGQPISDFPLCNKSFNLSYCGHDL